jgi:predicted MFS family arabinose efflux permease
MIPACYGSYQNVIYYIVLMAQQVGNLSADDTALRFLPMGVIGFIASMGTGKALEYVNGKYTLIAGLVLTVLAPIPSALTANSDPNLYVPLMTSCMGMLLIIFMQLGQCPPYVAH